MPFYVYILKCSDGTYYTGRTSNIDRRMNAHYNGVDRQAYTFSRRPVDLVWFQEFNLENDAFRFEHQIKGWSRKKKEALINGDWDEMKRIIEDQKQKRKT